MDSFEKIKTAWEKEKDEKISPSPLSSISVEKIIKTRINKERKTIGEYFWASLTYQILVYSFMSYLLITFRGDAQMMTVGLAGVLLYLPFSIIFLKKFKSMFRRIGSSTAVDIQSHITMEYAQISAFFRFKKRFDLIGIPVSCFIIVVSVFTLFVDGGLWEHLFAGTIVFLFYLVIFIAAIRTENKKRFTHPLRQFELIFDDLKQ